MFQSAKKTAGKLLAVVFVALLAVAGWLIWDKFFREEKPSVTSVNVEFTLHSIGELATQSGYFTNVQTIQNSRTIFGVTVPFTQKQYVYSYSGVVKAGLDFGEISIDVDEDAKTVSVTLPETRILDTTVDLDSFQVYDESQNIFNRLHLNEMNQSSQVMQREVRQIALEHGILEEARRSAESMLTAMLAGIFPEDTYRIDFVWPS